MTRVSSIMLAVVALATAVLCATAEAQPQGRGMRGRPGGMGGPRGGFGGVSLSQLLRAEKVQTALKVTEQQMEQLQAAAEQRPRGGREQFARLQDMEETQRQAEIAKMRAQRTKEELDRLSKILSKEQLAQLKQMRLQMLGFNALGQPEVRQALEITRDQGKGLMGLREALREEQQAQREAQRDAFQNLREASQEERMEIMQEMAAKNSALQKKYLDKAFETVLTGKTSAGDTQKEAWAKLVGPKFELEMRDLMRGRGPRGGGPGGQPGMRPGGRQGDGQGGRRGGGRGQGR